MQKRYVTIWFRYLKTDWFSIRQSELKSTAFVVATPDHGRMIVTEANSIAKSQGIYAGMALADARALVSSLKYIDDDINLPSRLLTAIAKSCIRFSPFVAIHAPDVIILDATGCAHLWGSEKKYLQAIEEKLLNAGYNIRMGMADTIGASWAIVHFDQSNEIISGGKQLTVLMSLPVASLRLSSETTERLEKLGIHYIRNLVELPRSSLRRRFGNESLKQIDLAFGNQQEFIEPIIPVDPYEQRLPCLEPIVTSTGIEIGLKKLLELLCTRLKKEQKGLRSACLNTYRVDNKIQQINIGTNRATNNAHHIFKLFEEKISEIEPDLGIELFLLTAVKVEDVFAQQEKLWEKNFDFKDLQLSELIDRLTNKIGAEKIYRYLPAEHHWPERSVKKASSIYDQKNLEWPVDKIRPVHLLTHPEPIQVTAPIPDYPPMLFRYKNKLHKIKKADGPERIEQEWWLQDGRLRDYYHVEDEEGHRYWLFRSGHYSDKNYQWFLHGFFA